MYLKNNNQIVYVEARTLRVHPTAQRDGVVKAKVKKFERTMDLDALGTFHAVNYPINGETALWVIDGQHRLLALLNVGLGDWVVRVEIHVAVTTDARASDLFLKLNDRSIPNSDETFRNEVQARRPDASAINSIVLDHGLLVSKHARDGNVSCVVALKRVYAYDSGGALDAALGLLTSAWGHTAAAVEGKLVEGAGLVFARYGDSVDPNALSKKLAKYPGGPSAFRGHAKGRAEVTRMTVADAVAETVIELYDRGRRSGSLAGKTA